MAAGSFTDTVQTMLTTLRQSLTGRTSHLHQLWDSSSAAATYAQRDAVIDDNTHGAHNGRISDLIAKEGALAETMRHFVDTAKGNKAVVESQGAFRHFIDLVPLSADYSIPDADLGGSMHSNGNATGDITVTLPPSTTGKHGVLVTHNAHKMILKANTGQTICFDGGTSSSGGTATFGGAAHRVMRWHSHTEDVWTIEFAQGGVTLG